MPKNYDHHWKKGLEKPGDRIEIPTGRVPVEPRKPQKPYDELPVKFKQYPPTVNLTRQMKARRLKRGNES